MTPQQFQARMTQLGNLYHLGGRALKRRVFLAMGTEIIRGTPVDTGAARSNWQGGVGGPKRNVIPPYAPGSHLGIAETANAQGAIDALEATVAGSFTDEPLWLSNNLFYITKLNAGSSKQAPANFVQLGIMAGVREVRRPRTLHVGISF